MSSRAKKLLSYKLADYIALGTPGQILTIDDNGYPHTSFTWVVTNSIHLLRFGVDQESPSLGNIDRSGLVAVQIVTDEGQPYLIKGDAVVAKDLIESAPFPMALVEMEILEVLDQSWIGVSVTPFDYEWAPEKQEEMLELEQAIYAEMRELPSD
ncbi:MAG: pyridoxamine 5'-phosphate oxidase family protein [Anaerolineales bacterium]